MKTNQEITASVLAKSKVILQNRAQRRKRIAASVSALGIAAVFTAVTLFGKGTFTHGSIPTSDPPLISKTSQSSPSSASDIDTDSTIRQVHSSSSITLSSKNENSRVISERKTDTSSSNKASSKKTASSEHRSKISSAANSSKNNNSGAAGSKVNVHIDNTESEQEPAPSKKSDGSIKNDNKTTVSTTASRRNVSSKSASSKAVSSKAASSKAASSKAASSKAASSKAASSKAASSKAASSKAASSKATGSKTTSSTTESVQTEIEDAEKTTPNNPDENDKDMEHDTPAVRPDTDYENSRPSDTDSAMMNESSAEWIGVRIDSFFETAKDFVNSADLVVKAHLDKISYEEMTPELYSLKSDAEYPNGSNAADLVTICKLTVIESPGGSYKAAAETEIDVYIYGGLVSYDNREQCAAVNNTRLPYVEGMPNPYIDEDHIFVLDFDKEANVWKLHSYQDGIIGIEDDCHGCYTANEIIDACK